MSREKQIEEILKIVCTRYANGICSVDGKPCEEISNCEYRRIANRLYNADCRKQEWISVEERLPGVSGRYICAVKDKNGHTWTVAADYSLEMKTWFGLMFGEIKNTVTHWMPLPDPPKKEMR